MTAPVTFTRPTYTDNDTLDAAAFNGVTATSATVRAATTLLEGVVQLTGDLAGTGASPALATNGVSAGDYGQSGASVPSITVDAKGRVTTIADRTLTAADIGAQPAGALGFNNKLINGNFDLWQRGTSVSSGIATRTFLADRMAVTAAGAAVTIARSTTVPNFRSRYSQLLTGAASVTTVETAQRIDAQTVNTGLATTVTFSAYVRNGSGGAFTPSLLVRCPTVADTWTSSNTRLTQTLQSCADSAWTLVSHTFDVTALTDYEKGLEVALQIPSGSLVSGDTVYLAQMDLREGAAVGTYEAIPYSLEFQRAAFFYEKLTGYGSNAFIAVCSTRNGGAGDMVLPFSAKRIVPTVTVSNNSHFAILDTAGMEAALSALTVSTAYLRHVRLSISSASMPTAGGAAMFIVSAAGDGIAAIYIDAEL